MVDLKAKPFNLTDKQIKWVDDTIKSMTLEDKIGQLFVHFTGAINDADVKLDVEKTKAGGIRFNPRQSNAVWEMNYNFFKHSKIPVLSAANVEVGGCVATIEGTYIGSEMKVAATADTKYAYELGRVSGIEMKAVGSNWAFAPVVDLVQSWRNAGISTRAFGSDPDLVIKMSKAYFKGISESGIACAMKHFPGDGSEERDPHISTSVNSLSVKEWDNTYGKVYKELIDAGIQSIMPGHIMMPAYQKHFSPDTKDKDLVPATLSKELLTDLLRGKLGFNGLIVSDASHMVGLTGRAKRSDFVPGAIIAGCDMFLFYNDIKEDTKYMLDAYQDGRLTDERLTDALKRILALKASIGLDEFTMEKFPDKSGFSEIGKEEYKQIANEISDKAITLVKSIDSGVLPISPKKHKKVMVLSVGPKAPPMKIAGMEIKPRELDKIIKTKLEELGFKVTIFGEDELPVKSSTESNKGAYGGKKSIASLTDNFDLVISFADVSGAMKSSQRIDWASSKGGWDNPWYVNELPVIFVSFNCPFHLADAPQIKTYINCYDSNDATINALVDKLTGKSEFTGVSPVDAFCGMIDTKF